MLPVGWGVVGFGWVARDFGVPAIRASGGRVIGVADPSAGARASALRDGLDAHDGIDALLADAAVEVVYVATPNDRHRDVVERVAAAGKAILCEKPMAATLDDAEAMAAAVRRSGVLYGTAFDQRHHPAHAAMRDALRDGMAGTVTSVRIVYACWLDRSWSKSGSNWRADAIRAGGGALMDLAPHGLDLIEFLLDDPVVEVAALTQHRVQDYEVEDGAMLVGRTTRGILASLHVSYNHPETLPRRRLEIVGTGGMLVADDTMGQHAGGRVVWLDAASGRTETLAVDPVSPFERQMRAFGEAVRGIGTGAFDLARDLDTMRLVARAYESARCR